MLFRFFNKVTNCVYFDFFFMLVINADEALAAPEKKFTFYVENIFLFSYPDLLTSFDERWFGELGMLFSFFLMAEYVFSFFLTFPFPGVPLPKLVWLLHNNLKRICNFIHIIRSLLLSTLISFDYAASQPFVCFLNIFLSVVILIDVTIQPASIFKYLTAGSQVGKFW